MSYAKLHHGNRSRHTVIQEEGSLSPDLDMDPDSDDGRSNDGVDGREENFEMRDLSHVPSGSITREDVFDPDSEGWKSEGERNREFSKTRRASASTVQSFMLYTPDEERAVIKKFDRRLVLFVALLYMLSFLYRSSKFLFS